MFGWIPFPPCVWVSFSTLFRSGGVEPGGLGCWVSPWLAVLEHPKMQELGRDTCGARSGLGGCRSRWPPWAPSWSRRRSGQGGAMGSAVSYENHHENLLSVGPTLEATAGGSQARPGVGQDLPHSSRGGWALLTHGLWTTLHQCRCLLND